MPDIVKVAGKVKRHTNIDPRLYVQDWKLYLPPGSRWHPKDPGDPACTICEGTGWVIYDNIPIESPLFGKLQFCDCVSDEVREKWRKEELKRARKNGKRSSDDDEED